MEGDNLEKKRGTIKKWDATEVKVTLILVRSLTNASKQKTLQVISKMREVIIMSIWKHPLGNERSWLWTSKTSKDQLSKDQLMLGSINDGANSH